MTKSRGILAKRIVWTAAQIVELKRRYPGERTDKIAAALGIPLAKVYARASSLGLHKTAQYLASPDGGRLNDGKKGMKTRFQPKHIPWNKDMKGLVIGGVETQFKPGQSPHNEKPIGSCRITKDGTLQQKISDAKGNNSQRWRGVHELVWIAANGPVPPKSIVVFKPGQRTAELDDIKIDRVECITLAENMSRNTRHNLPKELSDLIQLRGALNRKINHRIKNEQHD